MRPNDYEICAVLAQRDTNGMTWNSVSQWAAAKGIGVYTPEQWRGYVRRYLARQAATDNLQDRVQAEQDVGVEVTENNPRVASLLAKGEVTLDNELYLSKATLSEWGFNTKTGQPNYSVRAELRPIPGAVNLKRLKEAILQDIKDIAKERLCAAGEAPVPPTGDFLLEISTVDLHIGKRVWAEQCIDGEYNSEIALERASEATNHFLNRAADYPVAQIILPIGHDLLHFDNMRFTTNRGTQMTPDGIYEEVYRMAAKFLRWQIETCAEVAPVTVKVVPGNHDWTSVFSLGELLAAVYEDCPYVAVDNSVNTRKYFRWGQTLLGYTHGDQINKIETLATAMADERGKDWAETRFHEWRLGHLHNQFKWTLRSHDQNRTTGVHYMPSLCGTDKWHHEQGYRHHPRAEAYLWCRNTGLDTTFTYNANIDKRR